MRSSRSGICSLATVTGAGWKRQPLVGRTTVIVRDLPVHRTGSRSDGNAAWAGRPSLPMGPIGQGARLGFSGSRFPYGRCRCPFRNVKRSGRMHFVIDSYY